MSESWVDTPQVEIPAPHTWDTLSLNNLIDVKNQLLNKQSMARGAPAYVSAINDSLAQLEQIISEKSSDSRGA